jgi:hypothetical protein
MTFQKWLMGWGVRRRVFGPARRWAGRMCHSSRVGVEALEDRTLLSPILSVSADWVPQGPSPITQFTPSVHASPDNDAVGAVESLVVASPTARIAVGGRPRWGTP